MAHKKGLGASKTGRDQTRAAGVKASADRYRERRLHHWASTRHQDQSRPMWPRQDAHVFAKVDGVIEFRDRGGMAFCENTRRGVKAVRSASFGTEQSCRLFLQQMFGVGIPY